MRDVERLSTETCTAVLSVAWMKAICRARGFSPPAGGKEALARFLAPRLLEPTGAERAAATLEPAFARVLHGIAMAESPLDLRELVAFVEPGQPTWEVDFRSLFKKVGDGLLSRGLVLVQDRPSWTTRRASRFERYLFHLPDVHRGVLPPYPVTTVSLGDARDCGDPASFCRSVLKTALGPAPKAESLPARLAATLVVGEGPVRLGDTAIRDLAHFSRRARQAWARDKSRKSTALTSRATPPGPRRAAAHILAHLPPEEGVTAAALHAALSEIGRELPKKALAASLEEGAEAGFLVRGGAPGAPAYRAAEEEAGGGHTSDGSAPLACRAFERGVRVQLATTGLDALFSLAAVCRATPRGRDLELVPDPVLLGRKVKDLASMPALGEARAASPAFEGAAAKALERQGTLLLHEGLLVLRVEDLALRTVLEHALGPRLRPLTGSWLAVPRALEAKVEKLAAKEGFTPRRVG